MRLCTKKVYNFLSNPQRKKERKKQTNIPEKGEKERGISASSQSLEAQQIPG
jgi:hypothetical protein